MTEKELDALVQELQGSYLDLREYIANVRGGDVTEEELDAHADELQENELELREFVVQSLASAN